jgi:hypothetical protein
MAIVILPSSGVNLMALDSRLTSTWWNRKEGHDCYTEVH